MVYNYCLLIRKAMQHVRDEIRVKLISSCVLIISFPLSRYFGHFPLVKFDGNATVYTVDTPIMTSGGLTYCMCH